MLFRFLVILGMVVFLACIGWYFRKNMELSLVGRNLLEENHLEYIAEYYTLATEVPRSFYMKLQWGF